MRKVFFVLLAVSPLVFGLPTEGEGETKEFTGCINTINFNLGPEVTRIIVQVGSNSLWLQRDGITVGGGAPYLTYAQAAALEPILGTLRAGAAARVKAFVRWDDSTNLVHVVQVLFDSPCS
jgi:hypothetical protein